jgi:hypothetical protein
MNKQQGDDVTGGALQSYHEVRYKSKYHPSTSKHASEPRHRLFGLTNDSSKAQQAQMAPPPSVGPQQQQHHQMMNQRVAAESQAFSQQPWNQQSSLMNGSRQGNLFSNAGASARFGTLSTVPNANSTGALFGASNANQQGALFGACLQSRSNAVGFSGGSSEGAEEEMECEEDMGSGLFGDGDDSTVTPKPPSLSEPEASWSESGLTASYDIPGLRTIAPSHTKRRHRIASVPLSNITFSHIIIPKLRPAAFLKARICNSSSITLLKGPVGLTLDGSFLGNTTLPRCSAGNSFSLSLGVDPGINVSYAKPVVKRSQTGVFSKDNSGVYTRICTITNTKSNPALEGVILDQVPVSEDEWLRVEVLQPGGLYKEGDAVRAGTPVVGGREGTKRGEGKWGHAKAVMKKDGEVAWEVKVEPGRGARFVLEYEARWPGGDAVVGVRGADDGGR